MTILIVVALLVTLVTLIVSVWVEGDYSFALFISLCVWGVVLVVATIPDAKTSGTTVPCSEYQNTRLSDVPLRCVPIYVTTEAK